MEILRRSLLAIVAAVIATDLAWACAVHFDIDVGAYLALAILSATLYAGSWYYRRLRGDEALSALLFGTGFLVAFSAAFSMLNYFLLTVAGPRIDGLLASIDRAMGFDWPQIMALAASHPLANAVLLFAYGSVLPQIAVLVVALGWKAKADEIYALCLSLAFAAIVTVSVWTLFPSFGAFSVYDLPHSVDAHLALALDRNYADKLIALLAHGPGRIAPAEVRGLIGFPSYHMVMAALVAWHARGLAYLRWPILALNLLVAVATPIQGGHDLIDVLGGIAVAGFAIAAAHGVSRLAASKTAARSSIVYPAPAGAVTSL